MTADACVFPPFGGGSGGSGDFPQPGNATTTNVPRAASSTVLKASNADRRGLIIVNASGGFLFVKLGANGDASDWGVRVPPRGHFELPAPVYTGPVTGAWSTAGSGSAKVTEVAD